jgi:hypothetical protein
MLLAVVAGLRLHRPALLNYTSSYFLQTLFLWRNGAGSMREWEYLAATQNIVCL